MRKGLLAAALLLSLLCAACSSGGGEKTVEEGCTLWYPLAPTAEDDLWLIPGKEEGSGAALGEEYRPVSVEEAGVEGLMALLLAGPEDAKLYDPFPEGTGLKSWRQEEDLVFLDLSEAYGGLSGVDLSLADGCIVLTLCQLPGVERVYLTVEGRLRPFRDQVLSREDLLLSNGNGSERQAELRLWFPRGEGLAAEERMVTLAPGDREDIAALLALLAGPESGELEGICPEGTTLLSLSCREGCYTVDLSRSWLEEPEEDPRRLWAVVDTLAELEPGCTVLFQVEGQALEAYGGLDLTRALESE